ncbi:MAG: hypothetical protein ACLR8P_23335 [Clostridium fessum]
MAFLLGLCGPAQSVFHQKDFHESRWNGYVCFACWRQALVEHSSGVEVVVDVLHKVQETIFVQVWGVGLLFPVVLLIVLLPPAARQKNNK